VRDLDGVAYLELDRLEDGPEGYGIPSDNI